MSESKRGGENLRELMNNQLALLEQGMRWSGKKKDKAGKDQVMIG